MEIQRYLTRTVVWRSRTGSDAFGDPLYQEKEIPVRWDAKRELVRNDAGEQVVSNSLVFSGEQVSAGDSLVASDGRSYPVISAAAIADTRGRYSHTESRL